MFQENGIAFEAPSGPDRIERTLDHRRITSHLFEEMEMVGFPLSSQHMDHGSFKKALGSVIYELRRERKLSQERLALEANVDRTRTGEIERGEANPTVDTLARIADVLGHTLGALIVRAELAASKDGPGRSHRKQASSF